MWLFLPSIDNLEEISLKIHDAIFSGDESVDINGEKYAIKRTSKKKLKKVEFGDYLFIEQNPEKDSHWAKKARNGAEILWVMKDFDYYARVYKGNYKEL